MAEWFKAADLRPAIIDAWVRTPLAAKEDEVFGYKARSAGYKKTKSSVTPSFLVNGPRKRTHSFFMLFFIA